MLTVLYFIPLIIACLTAIGWGVAEAWRGHWFLALDLEFVGFGTLAYFAARVLGGWYRFRR